MPLQGCLLFIFWFYGISEALTCAHLQGKKIATVLAGQAQEQVRKALANRDKAAKDEKRS